MTPAGRPLRFVGYVMGGWVCLRGAVVLVPMMWGMAASNAPRDRIIVRALSDHGGPAAASAPVRYIAALPGKALIARAHVPVPAGASRTQSGAYGPVPIAGMGWQDGTADLLLGSTVGFMRPRTTGGLVDRLGRIVEAHQGRLESSGSNFAAVAVAPRTDSPGRWSGTVWLLWRPEVGNGPVNAPLLGGSQAGARLDYRLTAGRAGQLGLYGRASRAFTGPSSEEAALGLAWRPGKLPVALLAERRVRLAPGGRNAFALLAAGGIGPREVARRVEIDGYAQAGVVGARLEDGFADGKASLTYRLTPAARRHSLSLGASLSGSIQPGAGRVDVGPELRLRLPLGTAGMRVSTEWRARIAGDARPASGPAITLVADF